MSRKAKFAKNESNPDSVTVNMGGEDRTFPINNDDPSRVTTVPVQTMSSQSTIGEPTPTRVVLGEGNL